MAGRIFDSSRRLRPHAGRVALSALLLVLACAGAAQSALTFATGLVGVRVPPGGRGLRVRQPGPALAQGAPSPASATADGAQPAAVLALAAGLGALLALPRARRPGASRAPPVTARLGQMQPSLPDAGIALDEKVDRKQQLKEQFENEKWWRVLLHNDDIHTFEYVTGCLTRVVQHLSRRKAYNITWEAHSSGKATVACVWKSLAEQFCVNLQQKGLTVSIAPDSKFEGNKGSE
mmetsp:Transcript_55363/g.124728  ORF Transcript_55363/g.124728 Transcript_55363/m.124728 type:complete len:234 (-) Transcript_55363:83-784(-)